MPVIDGEVPAPRPAEPRYGKFDLASARTAPVLELQSMTSELEGAVVTESSTEKLVMSLGSDVLFAFNEAKLTGAARTTIERAAATIRSASPERSRSSGTPTIKGRPRPTRCCPSAVPLRSRRPSVPLSRATTTASRPRAAASPSLGSPTTARRTARRTAE
nr:hypothetical protein [Sanguibacter massiliensis]